MRTYFSRSAYCNAAIAKSNYSTSKMFDRIAENLQFTYIDVRYSDFKRMHAIDGWIGRKIVALPAAAWYGTVKTIYHLTEAVLTGLFPISSNNSAKIQLFHVARDLQESFGWLTTLVNDSFGQFHAQEASFQKSCYDYYISNHINPTYTPYNFSGLNFTKSDGEDAVLKALNQCTSSGEARRVMLGANYNAQNSKKVAIALFKIDPTLLSYLTYSLKNDENVVTEALKCCRSPQQAQQVIIAADYNAKYSTKVAFTLLKIDPTLLRHLNYNLQQNEDIVIEALKHCKTSQQAKTVIMDAAYSLRRNMKVATALINIDPTLFGLLSLEIRNDLQMALLLIDRSTEQTIQQIWNSFGRRNQLDDLVRAKMKEKYPKFSLNKPFEDTGRYTFHFDFPDFNTFPEFNTRTPPYRPAPAALPKSWTEPEDLKGVDSEAANIARRILKKHHESGAELNKNTVSKWQAKQIFCQLLELPTNTSNESLKKAYRKASLQLHPDRCSLKSGNEAFILLDAAYKQATL